MSVPHAPLPAGFAYRASRPVETVLAKLGCAVVAQDTIKNRTTKTMNQVSSRYHS